MQRSADLFFLLRAAALLCVLVRSVYAGERFRAAVSVSCNVEHGVQQMAVKLELQSASRRCSLLESPSSSAGSPQFTFAAFPSDGHASYVVSDVLVEPGLHCLVCSISYRDSNPTAQSSAAPLSYQKFFKFNVLSALSIASMVHAREDWLLAELVVTNTTPRPLRVTHVHVDTRSEHEARAEGDTADADIHSTPSKGRPASASAHFLVHSIDAAPTVLPPSSSSSPMSPSARPSAVSPSVDCLLAPSASRIYLFRVEQLSVDSRRVADIGRVSVEWRQHMGELCRLQAACAVHRLVRTTSSQMAAASQPANSNSVSSSQPPAAATAAAPSAAFPPLPPAPSAARSSDAFVQLVSCPATAVLERPFPVRLLVSNPLPVALHRCQLLLLRDKMGSVLPVGRSRLFVGGADGDTDSGSSGSNGSNGSSGSSGQQIGTLQPRSSRAVELTLAGIGLGIHKIGGIRVVAHTAAAAPPIQLDFDSLQHIEIVTQE